MNQKLLKIAIRQNALLITAADMVNTKQAELTPTTSVLVANASKLGFTFSEDLLRAINTTSPMTQLAILDTLKEITGVNKNWTPLVKQWNIPTGESVIDHMMTWFANAIGSPKGTRLQCGHLIPEGTFPLERYNGCPYCGTPFEFDQLEYEGKHTQLKTLTLWTEADLERYYQQLLESPVAIDATQIDNLRELAAEFDLPTDVQITVKENLVVAVDALVEKGKEVQAGRLFSNPNEILRYLWYKHTGFLQIVEPKTIVKRKGSNAVHFVSLLDGSIQAKNVAKAELKLKYTRTECKRYASWINAIDLPVEKQCEIMHPKRNMWVRFIRALRLAEYAKRPDFDRLAELLDVFYNERYEVFQGKLNHFKLKYDAENTFKLLKQRPGLFARSLFSSMLWFGADETLKHFREVIDQVPPRLVMTLNMYADTYFDSTAARSVKPLGGTSKRIAPNKLLQLYDDKSLKAMQEAVAGLTLDVMKARFTAMPNENSTIYIDPTLYKVPVSIGDRSETVQDLPAAAMGTRFPVEGNTVRLFMQWGKGLPAQHLDMDLSCRVAYAGRLDYCSYSQKVTTGCKHSGDILSIPHMVGTAEYIELNVDELTNAGAQYVSFTCNAYSSGSISPNLVVGWMNSAYPMKISKSGVAYDPSAVQHQVRISQSVSKGLVFGVLDVAKRELIWLEMAFGGQVVANLDVKNTKALLRKLDAKLTLGQVLELKAEVHELTAVEDPANADEVYDRTWAANVAEVNKLLLGE